MTETGNAFRRPQDAELSLAGSQNKHPQHEAIAQLMKD
jgi:hypothetical protein